MSEKELLDKLVYPSRRETKEDKVVFSSFEERVDFTIPAKDYDKPFIFTRYIVKILLKVLKEQFIKPHSQDTAHCDHLHLNTTYSKVSYWNNFITEQHGLDQLRSIAYPEISLALPLKKKIAVIGSLSRLFFLKKKLKRNGRNFLDAPGLIYTLYKLSEYLRRVNPREVYFTNIYLPAGNIISYWVMKHGFRISAFVSGTPLFRYLQKIVASRLYLSNQYQLEEYTNCFNSTILASEVRVLAPFYKNELVMNNTFSRPTGKVIGVYTSGIWKRKENGIYYDAQVAEKEQVLIRLLDDFLDRNPEVSVLFFLHPIEKGTGQDYEKARAVYLSGVRNADKFSFASIGQKTIQGFHLCSLAVTSISNTLFERLYAGFKTLIIKKEKDWFPGDFSQLKKISFISYAEFDALFRQWATAPAKDFFEKNELEDYCAPSFFNN